MRPSHDAHHRVERDDSPGEYFSPVVTILGLIALCMFIMAPLLWMLWQMRKAHRDQCIAQHDRRTFSPSAHEGADGAAVESLEQHQDSEDIDAAVQHQKKHTPSLASKLRSNFDLCSHAVATYSHSFWDKTQGYFARLTETAKPRARRHRRNNRSGLSIDLPIMKRPAWQKLASGASSTITPSATTLGELNNGNGAAAPSHTELERGGVELHASPAALSESGTQTEEGLLLARPEPAVTVGLAIG